VETCIRAATKMTKDMVTVRCIGLMAAVTKESGSMVFSTALERWSFPMEESKRAISKITFTASQ